MSASDLGLDGSRSAMALVYLSLTVFVGLAIGMWSQLRTGVQVATVTGRPVPAAVGISEAVLSITALVGLLLFLVVVGRGVVALARSARSGGGRHRAPTLVLGSSLVALSAVGWAADDTSWYTPAGAALPGRGPLHVGTWWIRGLVAPITPAWVHPTLFWRMPGGELAAVLVAPVACIAAAAALLRTVRRSPRPPGRGAWDAAFAYAIVTAMAAFVVAAVRWIAAHPTREGSTSWVRRADPLAPGHTAMVVVGMLVVLTVIAFIGARRVVRPA